MSHWWATTASSTCCWLVRARNASRSLSSRRAWFSSVSSPVRRSSRREWWPASTTLGWMRMREPSGEVVTSSSATSNPSEFRRRTRCSMRCRSPPENSSAAVSSPHRAAYRLLIWSTSWRGSREASRRRPDSRSQNSPNRLVVAMSRSWLRCPSVRRACSSPVSASTR